MRATNRIKVTHNCQRVDPRNKLINSNSTNLGSDFVQGFIIPTQSGNINILNSINAYLIRPLTQRELSTILTNLSIYKVTVGCGDRRSGFINRFGIATNWNGELVTSRILTPEFWISQPYQHTLTRTNLFTFTMTDSRAGNNTYGCVRYLTIRFTN